MESHQSSALLENASLQLNAIQDALRDAQERQALAIQRSRDLEGSYVTEIKSLKVENERLLSQINNEATSRAELEVYMQKEMQECSKLAEGYREEAHRSKEESAEKDKQMELLRNERDNFNRMLTDKEKAIKRNEATFQKLINDLTDSLTKTRVANSELTDTVTDYQKRIADLEEESTESKAESIVLKKESLVLKESLQKQAVVLEEQRVSHEKELASLKGILEDYSASLAEMKPILEESRAVHCWLQDRGFKAAEPVEAFQALVAEIDKRKVTETALNEKLHAMNATALSMQQATGGLETQLADYKKDMQRLNDMYSKERAAHAELQQSSLAQSEEMNQLKHEATLAAQEREKTLSLRAVNDELNVFLKKTQEEKASMAKLLRDFEGTVRELQGKNAEVNKHCWNIADELKGTQQALGEEQTRRQQVEMQLGVIVSQQASADSMIKELTSSLKNTEFVHHVSEEETKRLVQSLQAEADSLREILQSSTEEKNILVMSLANQEAEREREKNQVSVAIRELTEAVRGAKARNEELSNALMEARGQLVGLGENNAILEGKLADMEALLAAENVRHNEALLDYQRRTRLEADERDEMQMKVSTAASQIQIFQAQLKESQAKYWETIQAEKEANVRLRGEVEGLLTKHQETEARLAVAENALASSKESMSKEHTASAAMLSSLRDELEKRLGELMEIRKERDTLRTEKESFVLVAAEREKTIKRNEVTFQKALESDRARLQSEVKSSLARLKTLETEKEELLRENEGLSKELVLAQREFRSSSDESAMNKRAYEDTNTQLIELQSRFNELLAELKDANRNEQMLREEQTKAERLFNEEMIRLEGLVKESKKLATSQVSQISSQLKIYSDEIESLKKYNTELLEAERKAVLEAEHVRSELSLRNQRFEELENTYSDELALLKADLKDAKLKYQTLAEARTQLEAELMEVKVKLTATERDVDRWRGACGDAESKSKAHDTEMEAMKDKLAKVIKSYNDLKLKFVETEESYFKLNNAYDQLSQDYAVAEREGLAEARGLRVTLGAMTIEVADLKSFIEIQRKEIDDTKANLTKLQTSSSNSINALLEELRVAEDNFTSFRKTSQEESNEQQRRIADLNGILERSKDNLEEMFMKTKADKSEREMKIYTIENELSRMKNIVSSRETRVGELEKQHQENRNVIQRLKEANIDYERKLQDFETHLSAEVQNKKRLEAKLASLEAAAAQHTEDLVPPRRLTSSRSSNQILESKPRIQDSRGSPLRRSSFDDMFINDESGARTSVDSDSKSRAAMDHPLGHNSDNIDRVTNALAAKASADASRSRVQLQRSTSSSANGTPDRKKGSKQRGLVHEVRETIQAASRQVDGAETTELPSPDRTDVTAVGANEYELSIERTQQFLRQRLGGKAPTSTSRGAPENAPKPTPKPTAPPNGATYLYNDDSDEEMVTKLQAPKLHPATPPRERKENRNNSDN